eukprot:TRINITY_DN67106_c1_g4_i1.p1 TRINITY_DN67106_c1_g4~~TRINITY_DN67106_c1_g4_i1.p1  ORF type:complete len:290 (-),score=44.10 TRINITY_DN67106_c1_g4_i1:102-971(-)
MDTAFWDKFYQNKQFTGVYDCYVEWHEAKHAIQEFIFPSLPSLEEERNNVSPNSTVVPEREREGAAAVMLLHVGCGNSRFGVDMMIPTDDTAELSTAAAGSQDHHHTHNDNNEDTHDTQITASTTMSTTTTGQGGRSLSVINIDLCSSVLPGMEQQFPHTEWLAMDATNLLFADATFDVVLDKGTLDAMLCSYSGLEEATKMVQKMQREVKRVLKGGGYWIVVSHESLSEKRKGVLAVDQWAEFQTREIRLPAPSELSMERVYCCYILQKAPGGPNHGVQHSAENPLDC